MSIIKSELLTDDLSTTMPMVSEPTIARCHLALTQRERAVLAAYAHGSSYEEIGKQLFISARTVNGHLCKVRHKTKLTTRAELVAIAIEYKLLDA
jgi:DNA-binding NarL/FixJ family response regulator